jgi:DNA-directed RNA polymerase specialized sigma24 family protein
VQDIADKMNLQANHVSQKLRRIRLGLFKCIKGKQS